MEKESRWQREEVEPAKVKEELAKRENRQASEMHHVGKSPSIMSHRLGARGSSHASSVWLLAGIEAGAC